MKKLFFITLLAPALLLANHVDLSDQISNLFVKDFCRQTRSKLTGSGGEMMNDIKLISLCFWSCQRVRVSEARRLYVNGMEDLLNRYNANKTVRPYLHNFPFTTHNVGFEIRFEDPNDELVPENFVAQLNCSASILTYRYYDRDLRGFVPFFQEDYNEAVKIVHMEREENSLQSTPECRERGVSASKN